MRLSHPGPSSDLELVVALFEQYLRTVGSVEGGPEAEALTIPDPRHHLSMMAFV